MHIKGFLAISKCAFACALLAHFFSRGQVLCSTFCYLRVGRRFEVELFFWRGQVLCSTVCHLRVCCRFEVKLTACRFGTNFHVGSPLGGLYPLSSPIICVSFMPRQKPTDANSQEVLPHTWDTNRDKKQICESVSLQEKKQISCRLTDLQLADLEIWETLLAHFAVFATCALPKVASRVQNRCFAPYLGPSVSALESYTFIL